MTTRLQGKANCTSLLLLHPRTLGCFRYSRKDCLLLMRPMSPGYTWEWHWPASQGFQSGQEGRSKLHRGLDSTSNPPSLRRDFCDLRTIEQISLFRFPDGRGLALGTSSPIKYGWDRRYVTRSNIFKLISVWIS